MTDQQAMNVLVIEGDQKYRAQLVEFLVKAFPDATVEEYDPAEKGRPDINFDWTRYDVLILDYRVGEKDTGLDWLRHYKRTSRDFPATILLTSVGNEDLAVRALRYGAHDYLRKQKLNGKKLAESVADAFNVRAKESDNEMSLTINASRFSKSFFYGQFDFAFEEIKKGEKRAVALIKTDGYEALLKSLGVLAMDDVEKYMASSALKVFDTGKYRSRATRFTDSSIAILIGGYADAADLKKYLGAFCDHVQETPPVVNDSPLPLTVSIGAATLAEGAADVHALLGQAEKAANDAAKEDGNSFVLVSKEAVESNLMDTMARARVFDAKSAIRENRIQAMFRPFTGVSEHSDSLHVAELFEIKPRFVSVQGEYISADRILAQQADDTLGRVIDRWMLRECLRRLLDEDIEPDSTPGFIVELSKGSCDDANLVRWVKELIKHQKTRDRQFNGVFLAVPTDVFMNRLKPISTLFEELKKQHGFRFVLKGVEDAAVCSLCFKQFKFDLVEFAPAVVAQITGSEKGEVDVAKLVQFARDNEVLSIVGDIGSTSDLHAVISVDIDLVYGDFIGAEQEEVEAAIGIETVSLD